ncbi:MAG: phosphatidate cytidylyltransferase [Christensenellales bacterium]|jgi:phosphatidate cytidylyltransferase
MLKRVVVGTVAAAVLLFCVFVSQWTFAAMAVFCGIVAVYEMAGALKKAGYTLFVWPLYAFCVLLVPAFLFYSWGGVAALMMVCAMAQMSAPVLSVRRQASDAMIGMGVLLYPLLPIAMMVFLAFLTPENLRHLILVQIFACTSFADMFALFVGMTAGRRQLCRRLSPKKTVEGFYGGVLGSLAAGIVLYVLSPVLFALQLPWYHYLIVAVLCGVVGVVGDLFASSIKRFVEIKDFGKLLPGHGGILDRLDSVFFTLPLVVIYYQLFLL